LEEGHLFVQQQKQLKFYELQKQKELESQQKKKEIKKRDLALKRLEKIENHLLQKLSEQVQVQREIIEEVSNIKEAVELRQRYNSLGNQGLHMIDE
jgi:hypothetical protein